MRFLLDTHVALWAVLDSPRLPTAARTLIADEDNEIFISAASLWEIAIKHALKRKGAGAMPISAVEADGYFKSAGYAPLAIDSSHVFAIEALPHHHADPFDRMLIAQATTEPLRLLTHDADLKRYGDFVLAV